MYRAIEYIKETANKRPHATVNKYVKHNNTHTYSVSRNHVVNESRTLVRPLRSCSNKELFAILTDHQ